LHVEQKLKAITLSSLAILVLSGVLPPLLILR